MVLSNLVTEKGSRQLRASTHAGYLSSLSAKQVGKVWADSIRISYSCKTNEHFIRVTG